MLLLFLKGEKKDNWIITKDSIPCMIRAWYAPLPKRTSSIYCNCLLPLYGYTSDIFLKYDFPFDTNNLNFEIWLKKLTFPRHSCIFSIEQLVFKHFFQKALSDCLSKQNIFIKDMSIEDLYVTKSLFLFKTLALYLPFIKR